MEDKIKDIQKRLGVYDNLLLRIYKNVKENGCVSSEDMSWIVSMGIPGFTILSELLGVQKSEVHSMCYGGLVSFEYFEKMVKFYYKDM